MEPDFYCLHTSSGGSGKAAADKRGEPQEGGCAPLLRFSPFEIPFPYLPRVRSTWVGFIELLLFVQRAEDRFCKLIRDFTFTVI